MEADDDANRNGLPSKTLDPTMQKKHQAMLERLSARHQARKSEPSDSSSSLESTSSFLSCFAETKSSIEFQIAGSRLTASDTSIYHRDKLKSNLTEISLPISDLEKLLAKNMSVVIN